MQRLMYYYRQAYTGIPFKVWMLSGIMLVNRMGSMLGIFLNLFLIQEKKLQAEEAALVFAAFGLGGMAGSVIGGFLTDRIGAYKTQWISLGTAALLFAWVYRFEGFYELLCGFFMISTATESYRPANMTAIALYASPDEKAKSFSLNRLAMNLGFALGSVVGGVLVVWGYEWIFIMDGGTCMMAAFLVFVLFKEKKSKKAGVQEPNSPEKSSSRKGKHPLSDRTFLFFLACGFLVVIVFAQLMFVVPSILKNNYNISEQSIMPWLGLNGVLIVLFEIVLVNQIHKKTLQSIIKGALLIGLGLAFTAFCVDNLAFLPIGVAVMTFGEMFSFALMSIYVEKRSSDNNKGKYMGYYSMLFSIAIACAPSLGFRLYDVFGFRYYLWLAALLVLPAVWGYWFLLRKEKR